MESINTSFLEKPHGFKQKLEAKKIHLYAVKKQSSSLRIQSSNREPQSICRGRSGDDAPKATSGGGSPTMKQEEGLFVEGTPVPELPKQPTPVSSTLSATNPYADLAPARKRKRQTDQEIPVKKEILPSQDTSVPTTQYERAFETGRPFAPAKKRVQGPRPVPDAVQPIRTRLTLHDADWYEKVNTKQKINRGDLESLKALKSRFIPKCEASAQTGENLDGRFALLRQQLQRMQFWDFVSDVLVKRSGLLDEGGLTAIFEGNKGVDYPWDIRADSQSLYQKWLRGIFDPDLLRGIEYKERKHANGKVVKAHLLQREYKDKVSSNYVGEGDLHNGQWWPMQLCAVRDGAHGEIEAGIHGQPGKGAYSIILAGGGYDDIDRGEMIKYCGTSGKDGKPTPNTTRMLETKKLGQSVRVLRSAGLKASNLYRPAKGLRYDGLYRIVDFEVLNEETAMHRFHLKRQEGQDPIRYQGVERRPNHEELSKYATIRILLGLAS